MPDEWIGDAFSRGGRFCVVVSAMNKCLIQPPFGCLSCPSGSPPHLPTLAHSRATRPNSPVWSRQRQREQRGTERACVCGNFCRPRWITTGLKMHQAITLRHCAWTRLLTEQTSTRTKEKINPSFVHPRHAGTRTPPWSKDARFSDIYSKYLCEMWHEWWIRLM